MQLKEIYDHRKNNARDTHHRYCMRVQIITALYRLHKSTSDQEMETRTKKYMKLHNYNYGYVPTFECSIHGRITVTQKEWRDIIKKLLRSSTWVYQGHEPKWYKEQILKKDLQRGVKHAQGTRYNIRVYATNYIAGHLQRYKKANYEFLVLK